MFTSNASDIKLFNNKEIKKILKSKRIALSKVATLSFYQFFTGADSIVSVGTTWDKVKGEITHQVMIGNYGSGVNAQSTCGDTPITMCELFENYVSTNWGDRYTEVIGKEEIDNLLKRTLVEYTDEKESYLAYNLIVTDIEDQSKIIYTDEHNAAPISSELLPYPAPEGTEQLIVDLVKSQTPYINYLLGITEVASNGPVLELKLIEKPTIVNYMDEDATIDGFNVVSVNKLKSRTGITGALIDTRNFESLVDAIGDALNRNIECFYLWDGRELKSYTSDEIKSHLRTAAGLNYDCERRPIRRRG